MATRSRRARRWWAKLALMILPVTLMALAAEGAARLYVAKRYGIHNWGMNWKFKYEPYILTRTNDQFDETVPPKDEAFRLLVIGGSTANMIPSELFQEVFEPIVGREVEVINLAQGGYIMNQERIALLLHGMRLQPDLLLTLNGVNDIVTASKTLRPGIAYANDFVALGVNKPITNGALGLIRNSQFINCVNKLRERSIESNAREDPSLIGKTIDHCEEALISMAQIAHGMEIPHLMVLQPYIHLRANASDAEKEEASAHAYRADYVANGISALRSQLERVSFPGKVCFIDATKAFDSIDDTCFFDEVHLTDAGNKALTHYIAQQAAAQDLGQHLARSR